MSSTLPECFSGKCGSDFELKNYSMPGKYTFQQLSFWCSGLSSHLMPVPVQALTVLLVVWDSPSHGGHLRSEHRIDVFLYNSAFQIHKMSL